MEAAHLLRPQRAPNWKILSARRRRAGAFDAQGLPTAGELEPLIILTADHDSCTHTHTVPVHSLWSASQPMTRWTAGAPPSICAPCGRGPGLRVVDLSFCRTFAQICSPSTLRSSDEPSVGIGLRSDLGAGALEVTTKPVSERLFALELQPSCRAASRAHGGESSAG